MEYHFKITGVKLWEMGYVPTYDGKTWRLHAGKNADVVMEEIHIVNGCEVVYV